MRRAVLTITLAVCVVGCGSSERSARSQNTDCPEGTAPLTAREVIGPAPRGYEVLPPSQKAVEQFASALPQSMSGTYRSHDLSLVHRRGQEEGTMVVVINVNESRPEDVVLGAKDAEREMDLKGERIAVDGRKGRLLRAEDGSFNATAPVGRCSVLILIGPSQAAVRDTASLIGARR